MDSLRAFALTTTNPGPSSRKNVNSSGSLVAFSIALTVLPAPLVTYLVVLGASPPGVVGIDAGATCCSPCACPLKYAAAPNRSTSSRARS